MRSVHRYVSAILTATVWLRLQYPRSHHISLFVFSLVVLGLIDSVPTCAQLINAIVAEAEQSLRTAAGRIVQPAKL